MLLSQWARLPPIRATRTWLPALDGRGDPTRGPSKVSSAPDVSGTKTKGRWHLFGLGTEFAKFIKCKLQVRKPFINLCENRRIGEHLTIPLPRNPVMHDGKPTERLVRFVEHLRQDRRQHEADLTVLDLRLACRTQRLTEYSNWSASDLDLIEREAVCYGNQANLTQLLSGAVEPMPLTGDSAWLHSPSPFAWT
jgi:hypothetical protein